MNTLNRIWNPSWINTARLLLLVELVALFVSTSLTSLAEGLLFLAVLVCLVRDREVRLAAVGQPMLLMCLFLVLVILLGAAYGPASWSDKLDALKGWRKILLLPIAAILFRETIWKQGLLWVLIVTAIVGMVWSYAALLMGLGSVVVIHNHATQGMFFSAAAFTIVVFLFRPTFLLSGAQRLILALGAALLIANVIFAITGRSGYLAVLILTLAACFFLIRGRFRVAVAGGMFLVILGLIFLSPVARGRIQLGVDEALHAYESEQYSSMGIRMVMWRNTIHLISERPFLGYGLGGLKEGYRSMVAGQSGWRAEPIDDPHNQFLKIAAEHGLIGLLVFLGLLYSFFLQKVPEMYRILGLGVLLAWCATSLFSGHFTTWAEGRFVMLWVGGQLAMFAPEKA